VAGNLCGTLGLAAALVAIHGGGAPRRRPDNQPAEQALDPRHLVGIIHDGGFSRGPVT